MLQPNVERCAVEEMNAAVAAGAFRYEAPAVPVRGVSDDDDDAGFDDASELDHGADILTTPHTSGEKVWKRDEILQPTIQPTSTMEPKTLERQPDPLEDITPGVESLDLNSPEIQKLTDVVSKSS